MLFHQRNKRDVALRTRRHVRSESIFARRDSDRLHAGSRLARGRTVFVGTATHVSAPRSLSTWERAARSPRRQECEPRRPMQAASSHARRALAGQATSPINTSAACYDCNQILAGRNDVVTRSHEKLRSTVRGTSRCKPGFGRHRCHHSIANAKATAVSLGRESLEHCSSRFLFCSRLRSLLFAIWNGHRRPIRPNL
jgi:hypothetical protein